MTTSLQSELGNYFRPTSNLTPQADYLLKGRPSRTLAMVQLDNVNRFFSSTQQSEDKVALVGFAVNEDDERLLDMYIIDYNSRSFAYPDFETWAVYNASKPTATMSGVHCLLTLERK